MWYFKDMDTVDQIKSCPPSLVGPTVSSVPGHSSGGNLDGNVTKICNKCRTTKLTSEFHKAKKEIARLNTENKKLTAELAKWKQAANDNLKEYAETWSQERKRLRHEVDTTRGLWCIDRDPKEVDLDWIRRNAFQLQALKED